MTKQPDGESRLDAINTPWSLLRLAHHETVPGTAAARGAWSCAATRRSATTSALVRDDQDADDLSQEVVMRLMRGQFANANPERGSFRRMLMVATHNLVRTWWSRRQRNLGSDIDLGAVAGLQEESDLEARALAHWKQAVLEMAWKSLEDYERNHPASLAYTVLRLRAENPDDDSDTLAIRLSSKTGKTFRPDATRQQLRRARIRFAQGLLEEIARGLDDPTPENVEEELIETGLMPYVQDLLPADWRSRGELRRGTLRVRENSTLSERGHARRVGEGK